MNNGDITLTVNSGRATARSSDRSAESLIDEEDSSGVDVHLSPSSGVGSQDSSDHEYGTDSAEDYEDSWTQLSKADVGPSDSASRPSTSNQHRLSEVPRRRHSRREAAHVRLPHRSTAVHRPHPSSPPSVGSNEDLLAYGPDLPLRPRRQYYQWTPAAGGQGQNYAPSYSSQGYTNYPPSSAAPPGQQLVPFANAVSQYQYSPYQQPGGHAAGPGYFGHPSSGMGGPMVPPVPPPGAHPYPNTDMMHHANAQHFYPYHPPHGYPVPHPMAPSPVYQHYPAVYTPPPHHPAKSPSPAAPADPPPKDDAGLAELKQMFLEEKAEREAREAAAKKAEEERIAAAEAAKAKADEIAAAAAAATTEAEKKAAAAAAEEAEKRKAEAEEAAAKAKQELEDAAAKAKEEKEAAVAAAAAAAAPTAPEEKKKPIKFKDAVGRKFSFPFHLCATWAGMEELIRQAFLHVDVIGPHVAEGHYDLIGPNHEIILPGVWETVVEPDWTITMHMWPMPEPKEEEAPPVEVPEPPPPEPLEEKKKAPKKKPAKPPGSFWFGGRPKPKSTKATKK